ncbi:hypothetical protein AC1031_015434 [Aphanomyces cochlioides]|nr:hypothetical protein AC1031_015434 [Aphanomyces cochlioides]
MEPSRTTYGTTAQEDNEEERDGRYVPSSIYGGYNPNWYNHRYVFYRRRRREQCMDRLVVQANALTLKQIAFHVANILFALIACCIMWSTVAVCIVLSPVLLSMQSLTHWLCQIIRRVAQLDIHLYNSITPQGEHIFVSLTDAHELLATVLYFACIKPLVALASSVVAVALIIVSFGLMLLSIFPQALVDPHHRTAMPPAPTPLNFLLGSFFLYVSVFMIHWTARRASFATRYLCCDGLEIYRYVYGIPIPMSNQLSSRSMGFGTGVIV